MYYNFYTSKTAALVAIKHFEREVNPGCKIAQSDTHPVDLAWVNPSQRHAKLAKAFEVKSLPKNVKLEGTIFWVESPYAKSDELWESGDRMWFGFCWPVRRSPKRK